SRAAKVFPVPRRRARCRGTSVTGRPSVLLSGLPAPDSPRANVPGTIPRSSSPRPGSGDGSPGGVPPPQRTLRPPPRGIRRAASPILDDPLGRRGGRSLPRPGRRHSGSRGPTVVEWDERVAGATGRSVGRTAPEADPWPPIVRRSGDEPTPNG